MEVWIKPIDGWGFVENMDGELAQPFEILVEQSAVDMGDGILGWRGKVVSKNHKYSGLNVDITPRHVEWTGYVVLSITKDGGEIFSGIAETTGLECGWK